MVDTSPCQSPGEKLPETSRSLREVVVPVFVKVSLLADDEMEAEVAAVEAVRRVGEIKIPDASMSFRSVISPSCIPL